MFARPIGYRKSLFDSYTDYQFLYHASLEFVLQKSIYEIEKLYIDKREYRSLSRLLKVMIKNGLSPITCEVSDSLLVPNGFLLGLPSDTLYVLKDRFDLDESYLSIEVLNSKDLDSFINAYQGWYPHILEIERQITDWKIIQEHIQIFTCFSAPYYKAKVKIGIESDFYQPFEQDRKLVQYEKLGKYLEANKGKHLREVVEDWIVDLLKEDTDYWKLIFKFLVIDITDIEMYKDLMRADPVLKEVFSL